ncbi:serine/threonine-protein kinase [Corynebacterium maris DSM 45190]|uniref:non-specific serine/threonine protein kinase n=1 Tax=Corynebacterium maris DSM 45190 TaxID=1224163 RepID=S5TFT7_9CORY|nr:serine/threonine-protein kinase [Corynebacterium maris]AGS33508.1 serine/threonine-protein kinase [Corynebacterium maris DSM 45190]
MENKEQLQGLLGDDYTLQWVIGRGGMSTVWLADDNRSDTEVAVKVLRPEFSNNDEFLARFRNEAVAAEDIHSDNVVRTYDYREAPDPAGHTFCFLIMEYVRGESLADLLQREKALSEELALDVMEQAAHGLSILHRHGLVHRDIKPGNLLVTQNGQVKITDFGIAKAAAAVPLTRTGMVVGTAQYVSPEQAQGQEVGAPSDVYSLGVVGYEMLAGERPFIGDSGVSVALAHVNNAPPALPTTVSAPTRELIGISLRKDPATRFADGNELALAVSAVRLGQRPPQPASAAMNQLAAEPSPTASTHMLGQTAQPTTIHPAAAAAGAAGAAPGRPRTADQPVIARRKQQRSGGGFAVGLLIALAAAGAVAAGIWAAASGVFDGQAEETTTPATTTMPPEIVTEWVTPTQEQAPVEPTTVTQEPTAPQQPQPQPSPTDPGTAPPPAGPPTTQAPAPGPGPSQPGNPPQPDPAPADPGTGNNGGDGTGDDAGGTGGGATNGAQPALPPADESNGESGQLPESFEGGA